MILPHLQIDNKPYSRHRYFIALNKVIEKNIHISELTSELTRKVSLPPINKTINYGKRHAVSFMEKNY